MSDQRTQTQVLYEVLAEEALRASSEIAKLRDQIPITIAKSSESLLRMSEHQLERFRVATQEILVRAKSFEEVASRVFLGLTQTQTQMDFTIRQTSDKLLEDARIDLMQHAATLAHGAARQALAESLDSVANEAARRSLDASEALRQTTLKTVERLRAEGWRFSLKVGCIVAVSMGAMFLLDRALENSFPWNPTQVQRTLLREGEMLEELWPKLDDNTREKIRSLMVAIPAHQ